MATRSRFSSTGPGLRESLGPPVRTSQTGDKGGPPGTTRRLTKAGITSQPSVQSKRPPSVPQRRQTQVLGRSSSIGGGRSSVYGQSSGQLKKDPRPLSDRAYQTATIKKLISFLSERNYSKTLSVKALQAPSTKEFLLIFNFILESIDESLPINGMNFVEEVPRVLKLLGYPFNVSKNHLLNVGSPHSWPILLGALSWLIDASMIPDNTSDIMFPKELGFTDEGNTQEEVDSEIMCYMYRMFMEFGEESPEYQEAMEKRDEALWKRYENAQQELLRIKQENEVLDKTIEELSKTSIPVMQEQIQQNQSDYDELAKYISDDLVPSLQQVEAEITQMEAAASEMELQIESTKQNCKEMEEQIRSQPMSASDAHNLLQRIQENEDTLERYRQLEDENAQKIAELQMQHNRSVSEIDADCRHVNDTIRKIAAVLPDASCLTPLDYDTSQRSNPEVLEKLISHAKTLRQQTHSLHQKVAAEVSALESQIISGEATQSALHSEQMKKQLEVDSIQHSLDIEKETLEQKKSKQEITLKSQQAEKHALEKHLMDLQGKLQAESPLQKELAAVKKKVEAETNRLADDLGEKTQMFQRYLLALTKNIEAEQKFQVAYRKRVEDLVVKFQKVKIPVVDPKYLSSQ